MWEESVLLWAKDAVFDTERAFFPKIRRLWKRWDGRLKRKPPHLSTGRLLGRTAGWLKLPACPLERPYRGLKDS